MAVLIKAKPSIVEIAPKNGKQFSLEEAQELVCGYVQVIPIANDCIMLMNEDGKLNDLQYNEIATILMNSNYPCVGEDYVVGDVVICKSKEF